MKRTEYLRTTPVVQGVRYLGDGGFQPGEVIGGPSVRFSPDGFNCFQDLIIVKRFNRRRGLDPRLPLLDLKPYTCIRYPVSKRFPTTFQLDVAVLDLLEETLVKKTKPNSRKAALAALKKESERAESEQIRLLLALPMNRRTHFLRLRLPNGGSAL
jgi:hypothetical protein